MASLCSISGELPQQPVVSTKSGMCKSFVDQGTRTNASEGNVYEKRLIEAYITANGTEPTTGASLTTDDLIDIQGSHTVRPRPPELTSIPALLGAFQQEWDALALEVFTLQQNLAQTRQELSTALYQHDAAVRVIARLTIERDEAREALRNVNVAAPTTNGANGDAMHVDSRPLPEAIKAKIISTQEGLMKTRRKRPIPAEWATSDTISLFKPNKTIKTACVDASFLSVNKPSNVALAGSTGNGAYTISSVDGSVAAITSDEPVTSGLWTASGVAIATSTGKVQVIENGSQVASFTSHAGSVTGLALHASGEILASCSSDKTYALYDLEQNKELTQVQTSSGTSLFLHAVTIANFRRTIMCRIPSRWSSFGCRWQEWPNTSLRRKY